MVRCQPKTRGLAGSGIATESLDRRPALQCDLSLGLRVVLVSTDSLDVGWSEFAVVARERSRVEGRPSFVVMANDPHGELPWTETQRLADLGGVSTMPQVILEPAASAECRAQPPFAFTDDGLCVRAIAAGEQILDLEPCLPDKLLVGRRIAEPIFKVTVDEHPTIP